MEGRTGRTVVPGDNPEHGGLDKMLEVVAGAPDPAASHAFLLVVSGTDPGRLHVIDQPEMIIGRSRFADIHISERALSQQHCKLVRHGEFHRLFDLGSTNGTFVNDVRVQQVDLKPGDTIRTGQTVFSYMAGNASEAPLSHDTMDLPGRHRAAHNVSHMPQAGLPVTAMAPYVPPPGPPPPTALARRGAPPPMVDLAPAGYAGLPHVLEAPAPAEEGVDLITWLLRGIDFFRRYWLSILLLTLLGAGLGAGSYKIKKPPAEAEFEISLIPMGVDNPVERGQRHNFEYFRDAQQNFVRPALIYETLKELGETDITPDRLRAVQKSLTFAKGGQYTFKGTYTAPTPEIAVDYLEVHLKLYKESEIEKALRVLTAEAETLEQQVAETEEKLAADDEAMLAFKQENLDGLPEQAGEQLGRMIELESQKTMLSAQVTKAQNDLKFSKKQLNREDPEIESRIKEAEPFAAGIAEAKKRIAQLRAGGAGELHPDLVEAKEQLAALEALRDQTIAHGTTKIVKSKNPVYKNYRTAVDQAETNYKNAVADLNAVIKDLGKTEEIVEKLPRLQAEYAELTRSYEATEKTHTELFTQLQSVKVRLELERAQAAARFDVITPPNVKPVSKIFTILLRSGIGLFAGFFLGIGLGIIRDLRRFISARLAATRA